MWPVQSETAGNSMENAEKLRIHHFFFAAFTDARVRALTRAAVTVQNAPYKSFISSGLFFLRIRFARPFKMLTRKSTNDHFFVLFVCSLSMSHQQHALRCDRADGERRNSPKKEEKIKRSHMRAFGHLWPCSRPNRRRWECVYFSHVIISSNYGLRTRPCVRASGVWSLPLCRHECSSTSVDSILSCHVVAHARCFCDHQNMCMNGPIAPHVPNFH